MFYGNRWGSRMATWLASLASFFRSCRRQERADARKNDEISIGVVQLSITPGPGCSSDGKSLSILKFSNGEVSIDLNGFVGTLQLACQEQQHNSTSANVDFAATASLRSILGLDGVSTPPTAITATSTTFESSLTTETSGLTETDVATYIQDLLRDYLTAPGRMAKNSLDLGRFQQHVEAVMMQANQLF